MEGETIKIMNQDLVRLDRFDGSNFTRWQDKVRFLLTALKIFYILDPTLAPLPEPKENDTPQVVAARKKREEDELICRGHILNALSDRLYDLYTNTNSAREIWEALENKYKAEEEGTKKFLISQYIDFKFFDEKPLLPQIHELQVIVNKLKVLKIELPEAFQVGAIVAKLPSSWKGYRKRILHKSEDYSLEEIQKHLRIKEESRSRDKMVEESNGGTNKANAISKANHTRGKNNNNKKNSGNYMSPKKNQEQFKGKKGPCFVCGKPGHYARECRFRKDQKGVVVNAIDEEIIATLSDVCVVQGKVQGWWYDTCATVHVTYDKSLFKTFEDAKGDQEVQMGNEGKSKVLGKGTIEVVFTSGKKVTLKNVLYVPDMKKNLVSGDLLGKPGIKAVFESGKLILTKSGNFVGKGYSCDGMIKLSTNDNINKMTSTSAYMCDSNSLILWHNRLAHVGLSTIKRIVKCGLIACDTKKFEKCEICIKSKMIKKPFHSVERSSNLLDLIHSDLCELNGMLTRGRNRVGSITEADQRRKRGMVLPFEPLSISFDEIRYAVDMPQEMKAQGVTEDRLELLKGVSGSFRPGILTALMGVTGAGKTTLMDVLAGRKTSGYIEGIIKQTDIHSPHVTVYESLIYSAWLRLPSEVDSATRKMFIEEVMELVELNSLREALVGLPSENGLSTEQRKRLTIAVELVANPSIIFMDEPTSGLDARAAAIVMRTVRNTVDTGRTVVCTIHQPSIDIFDAFDELLLLKRGGEEIYTGPIGHHSSHLIKYFEGINGISKIKDGYNPSTWMLELTSAAQEAALGVNFTEEYKNSELYRRNKALIKELSSPPPGSKDLYFSTQYSQSFFTQCLACLWKQHWSYWRNPAYTAVRLFFTTFIALMFGTIFWDSGSKRKRQQDLFNAMGSMYVSVIFIGIQNAFSVQAVVAIERTVFYRERAAGMYSAFPYAFGQVMIELPHIFIQTIIFGLIVYAMVGFEWTVTKFFWYLFFMYFTFLYFTFYGMMAVAITPNQHISGIVSSAFYGLWNLFSGFIIPHTRIPVWWKWYFWSCPVSWTLYGLVVTQFGDIKERLESGERVEDFVRSYFGYRNDFVGVVAGIVVGITVLFGFIFAYSIRAFNFQKR
uniref:ABC transporter G family member 40 n=1 Tax=Vitis vinifera TaxID=29760 RepID=F6H3T4_VITVI